MISDFVDGVNARFPAGSNDTPAVVWPLALARIAMGALWLASLRWKLPPDFESSTQTSLREWLELEVDHAAFGFYGDLVESVVLPNFTLMWHGTLLATNPTLWSIDGARRSATSAAVKASHSHTSSQPMTLES